MSDDLSQANNHARYAYEVAAKAMQQLTGIRPTVTSVYRSDAEQIDLYANRANNPYPVNRPGDSAHNVQRSAIGEGSLAIDSWVPDKTVTLQGQRFNSRDVWTAIRQYVGFRVPENDVVHGEVPNWRNYRPEV